MKAVRIRKEVETEEEILTGAAVEHKGNYARVQIKTEVKEVEGTEDKPKHYKFTLIEFETADTERLEERINANLKEWEEKARKIYYNKETEKANTERLEEVEQTTNELVELMADVLGGAI